MGRPAIKGFFPGERGAESLLASDYRQQKNVLLTEGFAPLLGTVWAGGGGGGPRGLMSHPYMDLQKVVKGRFFLEGGSWQVRWTRKDFGSKYAFTDAQAGSRGCRRGASFKQNWVATPSVGDGILGGGHALDHLFLQRNPGVSPKFPRPCYADLEHADRELSPVFAPSE